MLAQEHKVFNDESERTYGEVFFSMKEHDKYLEEVPKYFVSSHSSILRLLAFLNFCKQIPGEVETYVDYIELLLNKTQMNKCQICLQGILCRFLRQLQPYV